MLMKRGGFVFAYVLYWGAVARAGTPEIRLAGDPQQPTAIEIHRLPQELLAELQRLGPEHPRLAQTLAVYVADGSPTADAPAMLGSYAVAGSVLRFTPKYALRPGLNYRVVLRPAFGSSPAAHAVTKEITIPAAPRGEPTRVTAIYPSDSTLPDNQLRFYLHFSAPMRAGEVYQHIKLLKADGTPVERAFLEIGEELWDGTGQRLTLLIDPGRVKKGLTPRELFGPVLVAGQSYRLVIDKAWRDAKGQPLAAGFEKRFTASAPIETAVDARNWKISPPAAATREPVVVRFDRPLDRPLLLRMITVADSQNKPVEGEISLGDNERRWEFRPEQPWTAGAHALVVDTALEDSAGNNLARPFEVDVFERIDDKRGPDLVRIPFTIGARK